MLMEVLFVDVLTVQYADGGAEGDVGTDLPAATQQDAWRGP